MVHRKTRKRPDIYSLTQTVPGNAFPILTGLGYDVVRELSRTALMFELAPELLILTTWD